MTDEAMTAALYAFHRGHLSVMQCLHAAITAYNETLVSKLYDSGRKLDVQLADTDAGVDTAVVIQGFSNPSEAQAFISELLREKRI